MSHITHIKHREDCRSTVHCSVPARCSSTDVHFGLFFSFLSLHFPFLNLPGVALVFCFFLAEPFTSGSCSYMKNGNQNDSEPTRSLGTHSKEFLFIFFSPPEQLKYSSSSAATCRHSIKPKVNRCTHLAFRRDGSCDGKERVQSPLSAPLSAFHDFLAAVTDTILTGDEHKNNKNNKNNNC